MPKPKPKAPPRQSTAAALAELAERVELLEDVRKYHERLIAELGEQVAMKIEAPKVARVHELEHRLNLLQLEFANRITDLQSKYETTPEFSRRVQEVAKFVLKSREKVAKLAAGEPPTKRAKRAKPPKRKRR